MRVWSSWKRRVGIVATAVAVLSSGLVFVDARADTVGRPGCGPRDLPETGLQGDVPKADQDSGRAEQGYNCGLALVGHTTLGHGEKDNSTRNPSSNANMAWSQDCAYVAGPGTTFGPTTYDSAKDDPNGVAVIDVSNPSKPVHVRTLIGTPSSTKVSETINAIDAPARVGFPARHLLVVGQYGNAGSGALKPMDIYDTTDCANPRLIETYTWQENIHNLTISGNGKYVFSTQPIQMIDIDPLFDRNPTTDAIYLGDVERDMPYPLLAVNPGPNADDALPQPAREANRNGYSAHQVWTTFDGTQLYIGGQTPQYETFTIVNIKKWLDSQVPGTFLHTERPEIRSQRYGRGHSVVVGNIPGHGTWALHSEESVFGHATDCNNTNAVSPNYGLDPFVGVAEPFLTDVSDPTNPRMHVSRLGLEINKNTPASCAAQTASGVQASVHYHDFDNEAEVGTSPTPTVPDMHFAILSMQNAGIRVWDVRDPEHPVEVAYFNPGDVKDGAGVTLDYSWAHSRYVPKTGQIWFATRAGGFWVAELEPQVLRSFGLHPSQAPVHPAGQPGRVGIALAASLPPVDVDPMYCTLGAYLRPA